MFIRFIAQLMAVALVLGACSGSPDVTTDEEPGPAEQDVAVTPTPDAERSPAEAPPPTADELAAMAPIDLMVDLGSEGWEARYNEGAGIEVTEDNWAEAYEISQEDARAEMAAAKEADLRAAATEQWRLEPDGQESGWSRLRLTIRRYGSQRGIEADGWRRRGTTPDGVRVPDGIDVRCTDAITAGEYDGAYFADCTVFVGDTTVVYLSSLGPDAAAATTDATDGIAEWLETVTAPAS